MNEQILQSILQKSSEHKVRPDFAVCFCTDSVNELLQEVPFKEPTEFVKKVIISYSAYIAKQGVEKHKELNIESEPLSDEVFKALANDSYGGEMATVLSGDDVINYNHMQSLLAANKYILNLGEQFGEDVILILYSIYLPEIKAIEEFIRKRIK